MRTHMKTQLPTYHRLRLRKLILRLQIYMSRIDSIHRNTGFRDNEATGVAVAILALRKDFPELLK